MQRGKIVGIGKETIYYDFMHTFYIHIQLTTLDVDHPKTNFNIDNLKNKIIII